MVDEKSRRFEALMLPHLDAAYNLARWLVRDELDAEDIVQDAYLRAFRFFDGFRGEEAKPWLLAVVRNSYRNFAARKRRNSAVPLPEETNADEYGDRGGPVRLPADDCDPESQLIQSDHASTLDRLVKALPVEFREVLILREFEDMSYKAIAEIIDAPIGTVMSRLARARALLRDRWMAQVEGGAQHDMR
jgi:RNA polymerase sigma-70 factor (ECF subfamily)